MRFCLHAQSNLSSAFFVETQNKIIIKHMCNFTPIVLAANCHWPWCELSTALKVMFCSIVLILRITAAKTGRNV